MCVIRVDLTRGHRISWRISFTLGYLIIYGQLHPGWSCHISCPTWLDCLVTQTQRTCHNGYPGLAWWHTTCTSAMIIIQTYLYIRHYISNVVPPPTQPSPHIVIYLFSNTKFVSRPKHQAYSKHNLSLGGKSCSIAFCTTSEFPKFGDQYEIRN